MATAKVGQPAPDFDMPSTKNIEKLNENVKLADYRGKWVVLLFYPLDFTFVCPTELTAFSDHYEQFEGIGAEIVGVSTDSVHSHRAWLKTSRAQGGVEGLKYPLASDITKQVARDYGVLIEDQGIALRGLFVIDPEGVLRYKVGHDRVVQRDGRGGAGRGRGPPAARPLLVGELRAVQGEAAARRRVARPAGGRRPESHRRPHAALPRRRGRG